MKKQKVIVTVARYDEQVDGDKFALGCFDKYLPRTVQVTEAFSTMLLPLTVARVWRDGNNIKASFDVEKRYIDCYPAIGIQILQHQGIFTTEARVCSVGLCLRPNVDAGIKTIREQTGKSKNHKFDPLDKDTWPIRNRIVLCYHSKSKTWITGSMSMSGHWEEYGNDITHWRYCPKEPK